MNYKTEEKISIFDYIVLFLLMYITSSFGEKSGTVILIISLMIAASIIFKYYDKIKISRKFILIFSIVISSIIFSFLINGETINHLIITLIFFFVSFIYISAYDFRKFSSIFCNLMYFLAVYSLLFQLLWLIIPDVIIKLPLIINSTGRGAYNAIFTTLSAETYLIRNQGIFWEPGAYQVFLNLALAIMLFYKEERTTYKLIAFGAAILSTLSTTGYMAALLIIISHIINILYTKDKINKKKYKYILGIFCLLLAAIIIYNNLPSKAKYQIFGKINNYLISDRDDFSSTSVRIDAFIYPFKAFITSPMVGIGYTKLQNLAIVQGFRMFTCTPVNWFAVFGLLAGSILNFGIVKFTKILTVRRIERIILIIALFLMIFSEEFSRNPSILIFSFYGYSNIYKCNISK